MCLERHSLPKARENEKPVRCKWLLTEHNGGILPLFHSASFYYLRQNLLTTKFRLSDSMFPSPWESCHAILTSSEP